MSVWDEQPDAALLERLLSEFREMVGLTGSAQAPEVTLYEIVAEV